MWLPLMDYAMKKGVSLSTLRRYIKHKKVTYRIENGRYLLLDAPNDVDPSAAAAAAIEPEAVAGPAVAAGADAGALFGSSLEQRVTGLERNLHQANEEIAELKMLMAIYEEQLGASRADH